MTDEGLPMCYDLPIRLARTWRDLLQGREEAALWLHDNHRWVHVLLVTDKSGKDVPIRCYSPFWIQSDC